MSMVILQMQFTKSQISSCPTPKQRCTIHSREIFANSYILPFIEYKTMELLEKLHVSCYSLYVSNLNILEFTSCPVKFSRKKNEKVQEIFVFISTACSDFVLHLKLIMDSGTYVF